MRHYLFAICLALTPGCGQAAVSGPAGAGEAEAKAYKAARDASDASSIALDIATIALHAAVEADADRRASTCKGQGAELQACQHREAAEALENGRPYADAIDAAHRLQLELRELLVVYAKCPPATVDHYCQAHALAKAAEKSPEVRAAVEEARRKLRNVRRAH